MESYKEAMKWASIPGRDLNKHIFRSQQLEVWNSPEAREKDFETLHQMISNSRKQAILSSYIEHIKGSSVSDSKDTFEEGEDIDEVDENINDRKYAASSRKKSADGYTPRRKQSAAGNHKRPNNRR